MAKIRQYCLFLGGRFFLWRLQAIKRPVLLYSTTSDAWTCFPGKQHTRETDTRSERRSSSRKIADYTWPPAAARIVGAPTGGFIKIPTMQLTRRIRSLQAYQKPNSPITPASALLNPNAALKWEGALKRSTKPEQLILSIKKWVTVIPDE